MKKALLTLAFLLPLFIFGQAVHIGDILCTDGNTISPEQFAASGKTAMGVVFYVDNNGQQGWAVNLHNDADDTNWVSPEHYYDGYDIPELPNLTYSREDLFDLNGYQNTAIIRATHGSDWYPAAWSVDFDHGWYLPSAGQLRWLIAYANEVNASIAVANGAPLVHAHPNWYWSSTEQDAMHAIVVSEGGSTANYMKWNYYNTSTIGVRSIRDFSIAKRDRHLIGDVVITEGGQKGIVYYVSPEDDNYWLVALNDLPQQYAWGGNQDLAELQNYENDWYELHGVHCGYDATLQMRTAQASNPNYAASHLNLDDGWHIPSVGQMSKLFAALPHIEGQLIAEGGVSPSGDYYWTSTERNAQEAWTVNFGGNVFQEGAIRKEGKDNLHPVRPVWSNSCTPIDPPVVGYISIPESVCENTSLTLQEPPTQHATSQGWQLSETPDFSDPEPYNGEPIGFDQNGWYLRYFASNIFGTVYSNTVQISVWPSFETSFNISSCTDYVWNGITYTEPGIYTQQFSSIHGCDSIVTLNLSFDSINKRDVFITGCDEITYNGIVYTQSGHYEQIVPGSTGCDTLINLFLNISQTPYVSPIHGETLIYYQTTGTYIYSIEPVQGCFGYEWSLDGPWELTSLPDTPECTLNINVAGTGTLKVRVYTECGYIERTLFINHDAQPDVVVYPNPTQGEFNIVLSGMEGEAVITIYDYLGQCIGHFSVDTDLQGTVVPYSLAGKAAGVYLIAVTNHFRWITKKVIKDTASSYGIYNWNW